MTVTRRLADPGRPAPTCRSTGSRSRPPCRPARASRSRRSPAPPASPAVSCCPRPGDWVLTTSGAARPPCAGLGRARTVDGRDGRRHRRHGRRHRPDHPPRRPVRLGHRARSTAGPTRPPPRCRCAGTPVTITTGHGSVTATGGRQRRVQLQRQHPRRHRRHHAVHDQRRRPRTATSTSRPTAGQPEPGDRAGDHDPDDRRSTPAPQSALVVGDRGGGRQNRRCRASSSPPRWPSRPTSSAPATTDAEGQVTLPLQPGDVGPRHLERRHRHHRHTAGGQPARRPQGRGHRQPGQDAGPDRAAPAAARRGHRHGAVGARWRRPRPPDRRR